MRICLLSLSFDKARAISSSPTLLGRMPLTWGVLAPYSATLIADSLWGWKSVTSLPADFPILLTSLLTEPRGLS